MKQAAVILAGCGAKDGSEIHEATLVLYALASNGIKYHIYAPDNEQYDVVNAINDEPMLESRNILVESARIARGAISPLSDLCVADYDCLLFPGGFGAAKNLFTLAYDGVGFSVREDVESIIRSFHGAHKPIAAMCIAPAMIAKVLGEFAVEVTLGAKSDLGDALASNYGAKVSECAPTGIIVDTNNRVVTTPAYMYGESSIKEVGDGAVNMVEALSNML